MTLNTCSVSAVQGPHCLKYYGDKMVLIYITNRDRVNILVCFLIYLTKLHQLHL